MSTSLLETGARARTRSAARAAMPFALTLAAGALSASCSSEGDGGGSGGAGTMASASTASAVTAGSGGAGGQPTPPDDSCVRPGDVGNDKGVGEYCTPGGNECKAFALAPICLADFGQDQWMCTRIGCTAETDCGEKAGCLLTDQGSACVPCRCSDEAVGCAGSAAGTGGAGGAGAGMGGAGGGGEK